MISRDQPTIFGNSVIAALSSKEDGSMKFGHGTDEAVVANRTAFLRKVGIDIANSTLVRVTFDEKEYTRYRVLAVEEEGKGMRQPDATWVADALITTKVNQALFLPLADCAGVILHDPEHHVLMVSHVGRHSVEQHGAEKSVRYLEEHFRSRAKRLLVWISPSVGKATYPLRAFEGKSLQEVILAQLLAAGVEKDHIEASPIDTAQNERYFSHSESLKGNEETGRFAIAAQMNKE
jgi:copper oxidase (laccase) domain-containing protein